MTHLCVCKYPLLILDKRDSQEVEYLAMPLEVIEDGELPVPEIDTLETEGLDGIIRYYVSVTWKPVTPDMHVKKYDVVGHVVTAGCELSEAIQGEDGHLQCDSKSIYVVLHPIEEWVEKHIIEISPGKLVS
jgi:hypothetical protein